jgi:hypothetical protein
MRAHEASNTFSEEGDDVALLVRPCTWTYSSERILGAEISDDLLVALYQCYPRGPKGEAGRDHPTPAALDYVTRELLYPACAIDEPGLDFDYDAKEGGLFRMQAQLFINPSLVIRVLNGPDDGSLSFVGMSAEEMR